MAKCAWALKSVIEESYHDAEWGVPVHNDPMLFELLILEGAQAGLSWLTILKKREGYRCAFDDFDIAKIIRYDDKKIDNLLANPEIVRNRLKIRSVINNAKAFLNIQYEFSSFDRYIWGFVDGRVVQNNWTNEQKLPASTLLSDAISKDLKKRGFSFVGSTICYAYMQAIGMVNDHAIDCYRHAQLSFNNIIEEKR